MTTLLRNHQHLVAQSTPIAPPPQGRNQQLLIAQFTTITPTTLLCPHQ
jgi:hypothetical protein